MEHYESLFNLELSGLTTTLSILPSSIPIGLIPKQGYSIFLVLLKQFNRNSWSHLLPLLETIWDSSPNNIKKEDITRGKEGIECIILLLKRIGAKDLASLKKEDRDLAFDWIKSIRRCLEEVYNHEASKSKAVSPLVAKNVTAVPPPTAIVQKTNKTKSISSSISNSNSTTTQALASTSRLPTTAFASSSRWAPPPLPGEVVFPILTTTIQSDSNSSSSSRESSLSAGSSSGGTFRFPPVVHLVNSKQAQAQPRDQSAHKSVPLPSFIANSYPNYDFEEDSKTPEPFATVRSSRGPSLDSNSTAKPLIGPPLEHYDPLQPFRPFQPFESLTHTTIRYQEEPHHPPPSNQNQIEAGPSSRISLESGSTSPPLVNMINRDIPISPRTSIGSGNSGSNSQFQEKSLDSGDKERVEERVGGEAEVNVRKGRGRPRSISSTSSDLASLSQAKLPAKKGRPLGSFKKKSKIDDHESEFSISRACRPKPKSKPKSKKLSTILPEATIGRTGRASKQPRRFENDDGTDVEVGNLNGMDVDSMEGTLDKSGVVVGGIGMENRIPAGTAVMAKLPAFSWWPGIILDPLTTHPPKIFGKRSSTSYLIKSIPDGSDWSWISPSSSTSIISSISTTFSTTINANSSNVVPLLPSEIQEWLTNPQSCPIEYQTKAFKTWYAEWLEALLIIQDDERLKEWSGKETDREIMDREEEESKREKKRREREEYRYLEGGRKS